VANFTTHLTVATVVSGMIASVVLIMGLATLKAAFLYWLLGSLSGVLPDIDAPNSVPTRLLFTALGLFLASFVVIVQLTQFSLLELLPVWLLTYLGIRYGLAGLFNKLTIHRGNFHSILAACLFGFMTTAITYHVLNIREFIAWFAGFFVILGYLVHLFLDELFSVDLENNRLKKSFGSAFKLIDKRYKTSAVFLLLATLGSFWFTPSTEKVTKILLHEHTRQMIKMKLLPH
jgi:hypothetical protein